MLLSTLCALRVAAPVRYGVAAAAASRLGPVRAMTSASPVSVLVPIADDSEEIETACITDTLVRAGARVTVASVMPEGRLQCVMSRGLKVVADTAIDAVAAETFDAIALPGGMPGAMPGATPPPAIPEALRWLNQQVAAASASSSHAGEEDLIL